MATARIIIPARDRGTRPGDTLKSEEVLSKIVKNPIFICTPDRTGSFLLKSLIDSVGIIGKIGAYFAEMIRDYPDCTDEDMMLILEEKIRKVDDKWGTKVGMKAIKSVERYLHLKEIPFSDVGWIWLRRRDKIRQAISICKGHWHITTKTDADTVKLMRSDVYIGYDRLRNVVLENYLAESFWEKYFIYNDIKPYIVFYEDFIDESSWVSLVKDIFDFLEISYTEPLDVHTKYVRISTDDYPAIYKQFIDQQKYLRDVWFEVEARRK